MASAAHTNRLPLTALLMAAGLVAGFLLFWRTASPLSASSGVDLDFLFPPLAAWSCLMLLSRLAVWARHSRLAALTWRPTRSGDGLRASTVLLFGQKLLTDMAWIFLVLGLLSAIPTMTIAFADRTGGEGFASVVPYTHVFGAMALWGILVMVPVAVLRAVADMRPSVAALLAPLWSRLAALGAGYVLLANGGVLDVAFGFKGLTHWVALVVVLGFSYGALVLRRMLTEPIQPRVLPVLRVQLLLAETAWITVALGAVAGLPSTVESVLAGHFSLDATTAASYVAGLDELTSPRAFAVMLPFALARIAGVFRPSVDRILGFPCGPVDPVGRRVCHVLRQWRPRGCVSDISLTAHGSLDAGARPLVRGLDHAKCGWHRDAGPLVGSSFGVPEARERCDNRPCRRIGPCGSSSITFQSSNAALLDHESTRDVGRTAAAYFSVLFDARSTLSALGMALTFAWSLPWARNDGTYFRTRPMLNAVSYGAAGFLAWVAGATLSSMGHGFLLAGAALASGMLALALMQVLEYAPNSQNAVLGPITRWLIASRVRGVVLGGAVAVYGLLLRPVLYESLWFAALYEYIALLLCWSWP